jgi:hypothetical protein
MLVGNKSQNALTRSTEARQQLSPRQSSASDPRAWTSANKMQLQCLEADTEDSTTRTNKLKYLAHSENKHES